MLNKVSVAIVLVLMAGCSAKPEDGLSEYKFNALSKKVEAMNNEIGALQSKNASLEAQLNVVSGLQSHYTDNVIGMKIRIDLMEKDLCPSCVESRVSDH